MAMEIKNVYKRGRNVTQVYDSNKHITWLLFTGPAQKKNGEEITIFYFTDEANPNVMSTRSNHHMTTLPAGSKVVFSSKDFPSLSF